LIAAAENDQCHDAGVGADSTKPLGTQPLSPVDRPQCRETQQQKKRSHGAGRAGRGTEDSVVFLIGQNSPIDQYLMYHSAYLFEQNPEHAVVDPDNPLRIVNENGVVNSLIKVK